MKNPKKLFYFFSLFIFIGVINFSKVNADMVNISTIDELKAAVLQDNIETINLKNDLDLGSESIKIKKSITVDGQGHTITYGKSGAGSLGLTNGIFFGTSNITIHYKNINFGYREVLGQRSTSNANNWYGIAPAEYGKSGLKLIVENVGYYSDYGAQPFHMDHEGNEVIFRGNNEFIMQGKVGTYSEEFAQVTNLTFDVGSHTVIRDENAKNAGFIWSYFEPLTFDVKQNANVDITTSHDFIYGETLASKNPMINIEDGGSLKINQSDILSTELVGASGKLIYQSDKNLTINTGYNSNLEIRTKNSSNFSQLTVNLGEESKTNLSSGNGSVLNNSSSIFQINNISELTFKSETEISSNTGPIGGNNGAINFIEFSEKMSGYDIFFNDNYKLGTQVLPLSWKMSAQGFSRETEDFSSEEKKTLSSANKISISRTTEKELVWGTSPWTFCEETGTLTIDSGQLNEFDASDNPAPWKRKDENAVSANSVRKIIFTGKVTAPKQSQQLFAHLNNLVEIVGLQNMDTSNVTNMYGMFLGTSNLVSLDLSNFDTSNVTRMASMFQEARSLTNLDLSTFNTSRLSDMGSMFDQAVNLTNLDLSNFNTSNVSSMENMFYGARNLTNINLSNFETSNVTTMYGMFSGTSNIKNLNLSSFDTSKVSSMTQMFNSMKSLSTLTLGDKFKFLKNSSLGVPAPLNIEDKITGKWTRKDGKSKGYSPADFMANYGSGDLTAGTYVAEISEEERKLLWGTAPWSFNTDNGVLTVGEGQLNEFNATENPAPWNRKDEDVILADNIKEIVFTGKVIAPNSSNQLFAHLTNLITITGLQNLETSNVDSMADMFSGLSSLKNINLSHFDTSKVKYMNSMFHGASSLSSLDISTFDTSQVQNMNDMFKYLKSLSSLMLGEKFRFLPNAQLGVPVGLNANDKLTGNWVREDGKSKGYTPKEFMENYGQNDLIPGTYVAQISRFGFKEVPNKMSFKDTKISNRTTTSQRKDPEWKMTIEDTRVGRVNWRVTAKLTEPFQDSEGNSITSNLLLFRKAGQSDQWINPISETLVFEGNNSTNQGEYDISWNEKEGPLIQTAPGTVKVGQYRGAITWSLVDAP